MAGSFLQLLTDALECGRALSDVQVQQCDRRTGADAILASEKFSADVRLC